MTFEAEIDPALLFPFGRPHRAWKLDAEQSAALKAATLAYSFAGLGQPIKELDRVVLEWDVKRRDHAYGVARTTLVRRGTAGIVVGVYANGEAFEVEFPLIEGSVTRLRSSLRKLPK